MFEKDVPLHSKDPAPQRRGQDTTLSEATLPGLPNLSDAELLSELVSKYDPKPIEALLNEIGGLPGLLRSIPDEIVNNKSLTPTQLQRLLLIASLLKRTLEDEKKELPHLSDPALVARHVHLITLGTHQEMFFVFHLDIQNRVFFTENVAIGTLNSCQVDPRLVFRTAIKRSTARIILAHNHPSGCVDPSSEDYSVTARMMIAGKIAGIEILDHVVVGKPSPDDRRGFTSLRELGFMEKADKEQSSLSDFIFFGKGFTRSPTPSYRYNALTREPEESS